MYRLHNNSEYPTTSSFSSENSELIPSHIESTSVKYEDSESDDTAHKTLSAVTEKVPNVLNEQKKPSEILASSSSTCISSSSEVDTDDSLDLDEDENEREQKKCVKKLQEIKSAYFVLKDMFNNEQLKEIENKILEIRMGTAKEYNVPLQKLRDQLNARLEISNTLKQFKLTSLNHKIEAEEQAIRQNFENDKEILFDTIKADLESQIEQLEKARSEIKVDAALWECRRRRARLFHGFKQPKPKPVVSGPCIVYMLKEDEILEDWIAIKKTLSLSKQRENAD